MTTHDSAVLCGGSAVCGSAVLCGKTKLPHVTDCFSTSCSAVENFDVTALENVINQYVMCGKVPPLRGSADFTALPALPVGCAGGSTVVLPDSTNMFANSIALPSELTHGRTSQPST